MSLLDLTGRGVQGLEMLPLNGVASLQPYDYTIDVSANGLTSLDCPDTSPNAKILSQVEILVAQENDLRDLLNVHFTFPNLAVLDVSYNSLEVVAADDQACLAEIPRLDTFIAANNSMCGFAFGAMWASLKVIDLSANALKDIPNFAQYCPNLITVDLSVNEIDSLHQLAARLPSGIEQLYLSDNRIDDWHRLAQLTAFAETLTTVHVQGNEFCERVKFSWKIFIAWLLPCAVEIDGSAVNDHERDAVNDLFRDATGAFSLKHLGYMEDGQEELLESYFNTNCRVGVRPNHPRRISPTPTRHVDPTSSTASQAQPSRRGRSPQPTPQKEPYQGGSSYQPSSRSASGGGTAVSTQPNAAPAFGGGSAMTPRGPQQQQTIPAQPQQVMQQAVAQPSMAAAAASPAMAQALQQLQTKVKVLQDVVKVLRQGDISRRAYAAKVIQKYYRGYAVRRYVLSEPQRQRLKALHTASVRGGGGARYSAVNNGTSSNAPASSSSMDTAKLTAKVDALTQQLATYGSDMAIVRRLADRAQQKAATTIQTYYRGYVARRHYKTLKNAYKRFTAQYVGPATVIQATIRMYLQRKRYLVELAKHKELEGIKADNRMMKARLAAMEKAMAAILSRLETVEQLALLGVEAAEEERVHEHGGGAAFGGGTKGQTASAGGSRSTGATSSTATKANHSSHKYAGDDADDDYAQRRQAAAAAPTHSAAPAAHQSSRTAAPSDNRYGSAAASEPSYHQPTSHRDDHYSQQDYSRRAPSDFDDEDDVGTAGSDAAYGVVLNRRHHTPAY